MIKNVTKIASVALMAGVLTLGVTACSGGGDAKPSTPAASETVNTPVPVTTAPEEIKPMSEELTSMDGKTVNLTVMNPAKPETINTSTIVLTSEDPSQWVGVTTPAEANGTIISFFPGEMREGVANPAAIASLTPGTVEMTMTNGVTGQTVSFTVIVK